DVLVIDRRVFDPRPFGLAQRQPAPKRLEPPCEHPLGLALLPGDEADRVFVEPLGGLVGFNVGDEPVLVLVDVDAADLLDGLLPGRHFSLHCGFKDRGLDRSVLWSQLPVWPPIAIPPSSGNSMRFLTMLR